MAKSAIDDFIANMKPIAPARVAPVQSADQMAPPAPPAESIDDFLANMQPIAPEMASTPAQPPSQMDVLKANMPESLRGLNPVSGPAANLGWRDRLELLKNIPGSMGSVAGGILGDLFLHPVQTAENLGNLAVGLGTQAGQAVLPQGAQNAIAGQAPAWLRNAANQGVQTAQQFEGNLGSRYGSIPAIQQTLIHDPAGALMDASFLLGGAGGALRVAPGSAGELAARLQGGAHAVNPLSSIVPTMAAPLRVGARAVAKGMSEDRPALLYQEVAKFPPSLDKQLGTGFRDRITETALQNRLPPTKAGVARMYDMFRTIGDQMDAVVDAAGGKRIPVKDLFSQIKDTAKKLKPGFEGDKDAKIVLSVAKAERQRFHREGITEMTPGEVKKYKGTLQKKIKFSMTQQSAGFAKNEAMQALRRGAKQAEETAMPDMIPLNRQYKELSDLEEFLKQGAGRVGNRDTVGFAPLVLGAGGMGGGGAAGAVKAAGLGYLLHPKIAGRLPLWMYHAQRNPLLQGLLPEPSISGVRLPALATGLYQGGPQGLLGDQVWTPQTGLLSHRRY